MTRKTDISFYDGSVLLGRISRKRFYQLAAKYPEFLAAVVCQDVRHAWGIHLETK